MKKTLPWKALIQETVRAAKRNGIKVGLCCPAPGNLEEFARFPVKEGIGGISFNPGAIIRGIENIAEAEKKLN